MYVLKWKLETEKKYHVNSFQFRLYTVRKFVQDDKM